jgi:uncharacterized tellurite resistance protein B-like protein
MGTLIDYLRLIVDYFSNVRYSIINYRARPGQRHLNCRVLLTKKKEGDSAFSRFNVQIAGSIHSFRKTDEPTLRIFIMDITDASHQLDLIRWLRALYESKSLTFGQLAQDRIKPVQSKVKRWQTPNSPTFCYNADLGRLVNQTAILYDWITVANLDIDWLEFARKGKRKLQFIISLLSRQDGQEIASAIYNFIYENPEFGYIDLRENIQRTKTLAVALAFAVSAADQKLYDCEIELIKNWAQKNFNAKETANNEQPKLKKAMDKAVDFFRDGNLLNVNDICEELTEIAPIADRYDILNLCLRVAQAKGSVAAEELTILKNLAIWLKVDADKFHAMMEKTLPVNMHQVKDAEVILGVTSDMSKEKTRQQLNKQFFKWHSRVTNSDPQIRDQADQMIELIAMARSQYVG